MRTPSLLILLSACGPASPQVDAVSPDLFCDEVAGGVPLKITGSGFDTLVFDALSDDPELRTPRVVLTPIGGLAAGSAAETTEPVVVPENRVTPRSQTSLELRIDGAVGLHSGSWQLTVVNPDQRTGTFDGEILVAGPPDAQALVPAGVCQLGEPIQVVIRGAGFLELAGSKPEVQAAGKPMEVLGVEDCEPLWGDRPGSVCQGVRFALDPTGLPLGAISVEVRNPAPVACETVSIELEVLRPATVTAIEPADVCRRDDAFTMRGTDLLEGSRVILAGVEAEVEWVSRTELSVQPGADTPPGLHDAEVLPAQGCPLTVPDAITVRSPPLVFDVDPPVLPSRVEAEVVARVSDLIREVDDAWLEASDGSRVDVAWRFDGARPGEVLLTIPAGLAAATYAVHVAQDSSCDSDPAASLMIRDDLDIALASVDPPVAWAYATTPVIVNAVTPLPTGSIGVDGPPRLWLVGPDKDPGLHRVSGVDARSEATATAIVPSGLDAGVYDLLAVGDDGALGWLDEAVTVVTDSPPEIEGVAPATLPSRRDARLSIRGRAFQDPSVSLSCREDGVDTTVSATILSWDWSGIEVTVPAERFGSAVCLVQVQNGDGSAARWAAVSITNPSQNLFPWRSGPEMVEARRAPAVAAGRTTSVSRWVYAVGGDAGDDASARASIELAGLGVYGDVGAWSLLPRSVPAARTRAGIVRLGRFLYLIGGHDGTTPVASVLRALILDPQSVPRFDTLEVTGTDGGPAAGRYYYRIAARFPSTDLSNPTGESLPSEPIVVTLPGEVTPTLRWTPVDGASGYLIYRTPGPDQPRGAAQLLAEVGGQTWFADDGTVSVSDVRPLPQGGLGRWHSVSALTQARSSPCVVAVRDPYPDPERWWIYAAGGTDPSGRRLDTIERVDVEARGADLQVVGSWADAGQRLSVARSECGAFAIESALHSVVEPGESWVFFVGGLDANKATGAADAGQVDIGGALSGWDTIDSTRPARAGFGVLSASNFLYMFGGSQGKASAGGVSADLSGDFPDVRNWNSLGTSLGQSRYLPGSAQESAVVIVAGGTTETSGASRTVDWTNW